MNKAVPLIGDEIGLDLRNAARRAAREEGKSLGEWLNALMDDRADAMGVSTEDLGAEDRLQALTHGLADRDAQAAALKDTPDRRASQTGPSVPPRSQQPKPRAETGGRASEGFDWDGLAGGKADRLRPESLAEARGTAQRLSEPVAGAASQMDMRGWDALPAGVAGEDAPRSSIEAKLDTLFTALNRSTGREAIQRRDPPPAEARREDVAAAAVSPPSHGARSSADFLGRTSLASTRTLDQAIAEIAERQALLNRAPPPRPARTGPLSSARSSAPAEPPAGRTVLHAMATDGSPALFASLKGDIARMSQRLEEMHSDVAQRGESTPAQEAAFDEIRSLLDRMRPDQSIDALERRVGDLTSKIDKALESHVAPGAFEHLSQRLEHVHASLSDRLSESAARDVDVGSLEQAVRDIVGSVGSAHDQQPDVKALEALMQKLADKLDEAREPHVDASLLSDLQAQVGRLAERIDRSDAGLAAIVSVERSLGELFSQMEETRDAAINAAENAARTAARDTLRSAMTESALPFGQGQRHTADAAVEQVTQDIAELKSARDAADKRLHTILNSLNTTLERVIDRLSALETDASSQEKPAAVASPSPLVADGRGSAPAVANPLNAAFRARQLPPAEPAVSIAAPRRAGDRSPIKTDGAEQDFLIEPGAAPGRERPVAEAPARSPTPAAAPAVQPDPASFIAAARRAAQAAAHSAQESASRSTATATKPVRGEAGQSLRVRAAAFLSSRRRPLLLALAGVVVLIGAVQVARLSLQRSSASSMAEDPDSKVSQTATLSPVAPLPPVPDADSHPAAADPPAAPAAAGLAPTDAVPARLADASGDSANAPVPPSAMKALPTLAMGPAANVAAATRPQAPAGIGSGLRTMAEDGNPAAQFEVGLRLADGRGVSRDVKTAADWFEKAAKLGLAPAAYRLGSLYEKGLGVTRDPSAAVQWYQRAAEAGNVRAMHNLAVMSAEGTNGKSDYAKAASWFTKAAQSGVRDSQFNLAILYARGLGIEQSLAQSYTWFAIAAAQGDADAATKRDEVAQRLDAKALAEAKKNAEDFQATPTVAAANDVAPPAGGWDAVAPRSTPAPVSSIKSTLTPRLSSM